MRADKLTTMVQTALSDAMALANVRDNAFVEPIHLMLVLAEQEHGTVAPLLLKSGPICLMLSISSIKLLINCHK